VTKPEKPLGVILAGGAGRRIGGDKGFADLGGQPLIAHVIGRLAPHCAALAINANDDPARYARFGLPVLHDGDAAGFGPLAGILAAMDWAAERGASKVLTAPVDTPFLPADLAARLMGQDAPIVLAATADGMHGTCGLWSVGLRGQLRAALRDGMRKVTDWTSHHGAVAVQFPPGAIPAFFNINRPEDLSRAEHLLRPGTSAGFDTVIMVDWSARSQPSPARPTKDAIFVATASAGRVDVAYHRTRAAAQAALETTIDAALAQEHRVLAGFDFPFGYPRGFARAMTGRADPLALWDWLSATIEDDAANANNRFDVAEQINRMFPGIGPFWGCPTSRATPDLPMRGSQRHAHGMAERREVERRLPRAQPCWKLFTTGSVGSQALLGLPRLQALRQRYGQMLAVRPFETRDAPIVLAEIYPSLLDREVRARQQADEILDAAQVRVLAQAFAGLPPSMLDEILLEGDREEGWIMGLGHEAALIDALG